MHAGYQPDAARPRSGLPEVHRVPPTRAGQLPFPDRAGGAVQTGAEAVEVGEQVRIAEGHPNALGTDRDGEADHPGGRSHPHPRGAARPRARQADNGASGIQEAGEAQQRLRVTDVERQPTPGCARNLEVEPQALGPPMQVHAEGVVVRTDPGEIAAVSPGERRVQLDHASLSMPGPGVGLGPARDRVQPSWSKRTGGPSVSSLGVAVRSR